MELLESQGHIRKARTSDAPFCAPTHGVLKHDGGLRVVQNFQALNDATKSYEDSMEDASSLINSVQYYVVCSILDLKSAYLHIKICLLYTSDAADE